MHVHALKTTDLKCQTWDEMSIWGHLGLQRSNIHWQSSSTIIIVSFYVFIYAEYTPAHPSGPPPNVRAHYLSNTNLVLLTYDQPAIDQRNGVITKYSIRVDYLEYGVQTTKETSSSLNYYAIKNPQSGTRYSFQVAAATVAGTGPRGDIVSVETPSVLSTGK